VRRQPANRRLLGVAIRRCRREPHHGQSAPRDVSRGRWASVRLGGGAARRRGRRPSRRARPNRGLVMHASGRPRIAVMTFNVVPRVRYSRKYDVLGQMALENHRDYCERHGYTFVSEVPIADDRPACWSKLPAIIGALETHDWVLWADSDTLV